MTRDSNKPVTYLPVLIPCSPGTAKGYATFATEFRDPQEVRPLVDADLDPKSKSGKAALGSMQEHELERFNALFAYMAALETRDALALRKTIVRFDKALQMKREKDGKRLPGLSPELWAKSVYGQVIRSILGAVPGDELSALERLGGYRPGPTAERNLNWRVSWEISEAVKKVRFVLWWTGTRFSPALYCPDLQSGIHVQALLRVAGGRAFRICPYCDDAFLQGRTNQDYCSLAHREAHRVARWRAKQKGMKQRRESKHVTRKTR